MTPDAAPRRALRHCGPRRNTIVTDSSSLGRTRSLRIVAALVVTCLLAVSGWAFADEEGRGDHQEAISRTGARGDSAV